MVTIANCSGLIEAQRLQMLLRCAGIDAFIPDESSASLTPHYFFASGVRVQVPEEDLRRAKKIIEHDKKEGREDSSE
jgi:hypothetical protein